MRYSLLNMDLFQLPTRRLPPQTQFYVNQFATHKRLSRDLLRFFSLWFIPERVSWSDIWRVLRTHLGTEEQERAGLFTKYDLERNFSSTTTYFVLVLITHKISAWLRTFIHQNIISELKILGRSNNWSFFNHKSTNSFI